MAWRTGLEDSMNLHEDKEMFATAVISTAQSMGLPEVYIEKDYWVTLSLKKLSESDLVDQVIFKGGTSLSKAYGLIHRFSEDIDLAAIGNNLSGNQRKKLLKAVEQVVSAGLTPIEEDGRTSKASNFRKTVYQYPRIDGEGDYGHASPELLIEVNTFTNPEPYERMPIRTMIADSLIKEGGTDLVEQYELESFEINVLTVQRTLVEKTLGVIKDSYNDDPIGRLKERIRHLYDVCMILRDDDMRKFIASDNLHVMCNRCIEDEIECWGEEQAACLKQPLHNAPLFHKLDEWWAGLKQTYNNDFTDLVYGDLPEYSEIQATIKSINLALKEIA